ncbi:hypothetical protein [Hymenobacter ruricola]|uniref:Uncharacterized protein n=1 Tax=Hymenobacter ruricola TaxID=2791023 RepID=A0ABS0I124_9BACT|nr:hypothetical protein [Hymenobacter ruricola]MBF9220647.1 hypothetical protein [Hymenobacter ruricola]
MLPSTSWLVAILSLSLPAEFHLAASTSEQVPMRGLPGSSAHEEFRRWEAPGERALHLFYWQPMAPRDGGPMHAVAEWPAVVAGQAVKVYETDSFMGARRRVLVTYLRFAAPQPEAQAMLYASGLSRAEFTAVLAQVRLRDGHAR